MTCMKFLIVAVLGLFIAMPVQAKTSNGIAAIVNDDIITHSELADRLQMIVSSSNLPKTTAFRRKIAGQVLTGLIAETVQLQEAKRLGLDVTDAEVDKGLGTIAEQNKLSLKQFERVLGKQGVPVPALKEQIRAQIAWSKVVQTQLRPRVVVTDNDVAAEMERRTGALGSREYDVSEIFIPVLTKDDEVEARSTANNLTRQLRGEESDFATLARRFSQSSSAANGGQMGWVSEASLDPVLASALPTLSGSSISEPLRTEDGYVILKVSGVRAAGGAGGSINPDTIRQELGMKRIDVMQRRYLRDLRSAAYVETRVE